MSGALAPFRAARAALVSALVLALLALAAGGVRVLPWLLDPDLPWTIALPFARSVASLAVEASILVGWPVGWALATFAMVERGEARVLATLGESPARTTQRLVPHAIFLGALLGAASALGARDATEPGRVLGELLDRGRDACDRATTPTTLTVPFLGATWLCDARADDANARPMRVVAGSPPGFPIFFTASAAHVAPDLKRVDLEDAWLLFPSPEGAVRARVHASSIALRGLPPFARASSVRPLARALSLSISAAFAALAVVWLTLRRPEEARSRIPSRLRAIALGASGPLAALGILRLLERADPSPLAVRLVVIALPIASVAAVIVAGALTGALDGPPHKVTRAALARLRRLLRWRTAASK
jgi:hypothetical protein